MLPYTYLLNVTYTYLLNVTYLFTECYLPIYSQDSSTSRILKLLQQATSQYNNSVMEKDLIWDTLYFTLYLAWLTPDIKGILITSHLDRNWLKVPTTEHPRNTWTTSRGTWV